MLAVDVKAFISKLRSALGVKPKNKKSKRSHKRRHNKKSRR